MITRGMSIADESVAITFRLWISLIQLLNIALLLELFFAIDITLHLYLRFNPSSTRPNT